MSATAPARESRRPTSRPREAGAEQARTTSRLPARRWMLTWACGLAALYAVTLATGLLSASTGLHRLDEALFRLVNELGPGPRPLFEFLENPFLNYVLVAAAPVGASLLTRRRAIPSVFAFVVSSALASWALLEGIYSVYDRSRPSEVWEPSMIVLAYDRNWARIESFPSGHMVVLTALAVAAWLVFPRLRLPLAAFLGLHAFTRVLFGAHFPLDVVAGMALGYGTARAMFALVVQTHVLERPAGRQRCTEPVCTTCPQAAVGEPEFRTR